MSNVEYRFYDTNYLSVYTTGSVMKYVTRFKSRRSKVHFTLRTGYFDGGFHSWADKENHVEPGRPFKSLPKEPEKDSMTPRLCITLKLGKTSVQKSMKLKSEKRRSLELFAARIHSFSCIRCHIDEL